MQRNRRPKENTNKASAQDNIAKIQYNKHAVNQYPAQRRPVWQQATPNPIRARPVTRAIEWKLPQSSVPNNSNETSDGTINSARPVIASLMAASLRTFFIQESARGHFLVEFVILAQRRISNHFWFLHYRSKQQSEMFRSAQHDKPVCIPTLIQNATTR